MGITGEINLGWDMRLFIDESNGSKTEFFTDQYGDSFWVDKDNLNHPFPQVNQTVLNVPELIVNIANTPDIDQLPPAGDFVFHSAGDK